MGLDFKLHCLPLLLFEQFLVVALHCTKALGMHNSPGNAPKLWERTKAVVRSTQDKPLSIYQNANPYMSI